MSISIERNDRMKIYFNPKSIGTKFTEEVVKKFPNIEFVFDIEHSKDVDAVVVMPDFFRQVQLEEYKNLKWIQLLMAGYDAFDFNLVQGRDIIVTNAVDIFSISIAEDVITKILVLNRYVKHFYEEMKEAKWMQVRNIPELTHSTVGVLGTGSIGKEVAKRIKGFGCKIIGFRQTPELVPYFDAIYTGDEGLDYVLSHSDYIVVALPLNHKTKHLLSSEKLKLIKKEAVFINVARGQIVDQEALIELLSNGSIRAAGLDVTTPEPLPITSPLWRLPNVFITPHNASSSPYMQERLKDLMIDNITRFEKGMKVLYQITE